MTNQFPNLIQLDPKFKIGDIIRLSIYNDIFAKSYTPTLSEAVFMIKKVKNMGFYGLILLAVLMEKKLLETFTKINCKKRVQN